jgi:hypothetical protein
MFESHLYFGEIYCASDLAEQLDGVDVEVVAADDTRGKNHMMDIIDIKDTNTGWKNSFEYSTCSNIPGVMRGFNIEYKNKDGKIEYGSAVWIYGEPDMDNIDIRISIELAGLNGWTPTGRVVFRGYGFEEYDPDERECYVVDVEPDILSRHLLNLNKEGCVCP